MPLRKQVLLPVSLLLLASVACAVPGLDRWFGAAAPSTPASAPAELAPLPPTIVEAIPAPGEELPPDGAIVLYFDQPMDQPSVVQAFAVEPTVEGGFEWPDDLTLRFQPSAPLERATTYTITIGLAARSQAGLAPTEPLSACVTTIGPLQVAQVLPQPGSFDIDPGSVITVVFNRPVVPLQVTGELPQPLEFQPAVTGTGEWVDTGIYLFRPEPPLLGGVTYAARIDAGLTDLTASTLDAPYEWAFTTSLPEIVSVQPGLDAMGVPLDEPIVLAFNQAMDRASVESAFRLLAPGSASVAGRFTWNDAGATVTFTPAGLLEYAAGYDFRLAATARGAGGAALTTGLVTVFHAVPRPTLSSSDPSQGSTASSYAPIQLIFTSPMDEASLLTALHIVPEVENLGVNWYEFDRSLYVYGNFQPSTEYSLTLDETAADPYGTPLTAPYHLTFRTTALPPLAAFSRYSSILSLTPDRPPRVEFQARNVGRLDLALYRISQPEFLSLAEDSYVLYDSPTPRGELVRRWSETVSPAPNVLQTSAVDLQPGPLAAGTYLLILNSPDDDAAPRGRLVLVRSVELVLKYSARQTLVWAVDLSSGEPLDGLPVQLLDETGNAFASGTTDAEGLWTASYERRHGQQLWNTVYAISGSPADEDYGLTGSTWSDGIDPGESGVWVDLSEPEFAASLYTDRPIYRPGQPVHLRGVVRRVQDARYHLPDLADVRLTITNETGETVYDETLPLSEYGTFNAVLSLSRSASLGVYSASTDYGSVYFTVAEYRKPEFSVSVQPSATEVASGDPLTARIEAEYYFGGPVAGAQVDWVAWASPTWPPGLPLAVDWFEGGRSGAYYAWPSYDPFAQGTGQTGPDGSLEITLPTEIEGQRPLDLMIEATLTESAGLPVTGSASVTLHPASVYLAVRPERYMVRAGALAVLEVAAVDWAGEAVAGQSADVRVERLTWRQVVAADGTLTWESQATMLNRSTVSTGSEGMVLVSFVPPTPGTYRVRAVGADPAGRETTGEVTLWVAGEGDVVWRQPAAGRIALVPDRESYHPGDTASVLVPSPFDVPATALVTVERGGVLSHQVLHISGAQAVIELPIEEAYAPNVFLSVVLIRPASDEAPAAVAAGLLDLSVSAEAFELQVSLTPDPAAAGPGEQVTYHLQATDASGEPVQAEFSLALADLAALALAEPNSPSLFRAFYSHQSLRVQTGASLSSASEGGPPSPAPADGMGGGGGEPGPTPVRSEFPDTAYWNPTVLTDTNGQADITLTLPDSLTTWRMQARGLTQDTLVGEATVDLVATRDLLIRPVTPRFFTAGDAATVAAVVHNNTARDLDVEVWLVASGAEIDDPDRTTVTVPAAGQQRVEWWLTIQDAETVQLTFHASGGGLQDASMPTIGSAADGGLPVLHYTAPDTAATAAVLTEAGQRLEAISLPRRYEATQGGLSVVVDLSLGSAINSALRVLETYPYLCTEQVISRFLPNLAVVGAMRELGLEDPELEARLDRALDDGLQTLLSRQNQDGGWGWWAESPSDTYLTAYALYGLVQARQAGDLVSQSSIDAAVAYLQADIVLPDLLRQSTSLDRQAVALYVLAAAGEGDLRVTRAMADAREGLSLWARALTAQTLSDLAPDDEHLTALLADLNSQAVRSATGAHWEDLVTERSLMASPVRTTAHALQALLELDPQNPLIPDAVRWLLAARSSDGAWASTHESAWAILALTDWIRASGSLQADYNYSLTLNAQTLSEGTASAGVLAPSVTLTTPIGELNPSAPNQLSVRRGPGNGTLAYTAHLTVFRPVEEVEAVSRGLTVHRELFCYDGYCGGSDDPCLPATSAEVGDNLLVRVTLITPSDQYYLVVEDPYPAGAEPIDTRLQTSPNAVAAALQALADPLGGGWGWWWFRRAELGDDHLALFADYLPAGTYQYTYLLHAAFPGEYRVLPTRAWAFYFPEVYGHGEGTVFTIQ